MNSEIYYYLCYFIIYAFLGWCTEVAFQAVHLGKFVNRGFLNGPVCPVYGFGMVTVIYCLSRIQDNALVLFLGAVVLTSAIEWLTGFVLEKFFHAKWWDYSDRPFNLNGYICLEFSIIWGLACLIIMDAIQPCINELIAITPLLFGEILLAVFYGSMLADAIVTVNTLTKLNKQLTHLEEISKSMRRISDGIGENIFEGVSDIQERSELAKDKIEEKKADIRKSIDDMAEKYELKAEEAAEGADKLRREMEKKRAEWARLRREYSQAIHERHFGYGRLLKAFPNMKHQRSSEALENLKNDLKKELSAKKEKLKDYLKEK